MATGWCDSIIRARPAAGRRRQIRQGRRMGVVTPAESVSSVLRNYVNFRGRAQRSEFWWFTLCNVVVSVILGLIGTAPPALNVLEGIYLLAVLLPSLAVTVRRLHDTARPAWWLLIYLAVVLAWIIGAIILAISIEIDDPGVVETTDFQDWPGYAAYMIGCILFSLAGAVTMIVLCAQPGTAGANRYGPDPLQREPGIGGYDYQDPGQLYAAPPESGGRQYCSQCGAERMAEARFCAACGVTF